MRGRHNIKVRMAGTLCQICMSYLLCHILLCHIVYVFPHVLPLRDGGGYEVVVLFRNVLARAAPLVRGRHNIEVRMACSLCRYFI